MERHCLICNKIYSGKRAANYLSAHLSSHNITKFEYFEKYIVPTLMPDDKLGKCHAKNCNNPTKFINFVSGYSNFCSHVCSANDETVRTKYKETMIQNHGVPHNFSGAVGTRPCDATMMELYGVVSPFKSEIFKQKAKETMLKLYGIEHNFNGKYGTRPCDETRDKLYSREELYERYKKTMLEMYGVENYFQRIDLVQQAVRDKYGVDYIMQVAEVQHKSQSSQKRKSYRLKPHTTKFGNVVNYQSNLEFEFIQYCETHDIKIFDGESIKYKHDDKIKTYYIDFKIIRNNKIHLVELKSRHIWYLTQVENGTIAAKNEAAQSYSDMMGYGKFIYYFHEDTTKYETDFGLGSIDSDGLE